VTEAEWFSCQDPRAMHERLGRVGGLSRRQARLYAAACCRRIWGLLDDAGRAAVEVAERFADRAATSSELAAAARLTTGPGKSAAALRLVRAGDAAAQAAARAAGQDAYTRVMVAHAGRPKPDLRPVAAALGISVWTAGDPRDAYLAVEGRERAAQADVLRDIVGPGLFRPVLFDPAWRTAAAVGIAHAVSGDRAFVRMPVLADALQDAGCEDADILHHCRGGGPHVPGCWVTDLVLGKT
jgi:hypothetical protein